MAFQLPWGNEGLHKISVPYRSGKKFSDRHIEYHCEPLNVVDGDVRDLPLDLTDVGSMKAGQFRKSFLRMAQREAQTKDVLCQKYPCVLCLPKIFRHLKRLPKHWTKIYSPYIYLFCIYRLFV